MLRGAAVPDSPPPSYESLIPTFQEPYVPPRYLSASEGRNSIRYSQLPPLYDLTKIYLIDNKSADIASLNYQNDHSNFLTSVVQNSDFTPQEASTQTINFDDRSRWGGDFKTILHMNIPNVTEFMFSNSFGARLMTSKVNGVPTYEWVTLTIPEGNYSDIMVMDLMNNAVLEHYLRVGRNNGVAEEDIGVKFDTRNFRLGWDPETKLVMPGSYTYEAFHPDIVLLPGCGVDFTYSRLNNLLGIRKRQPFQEGFRITYDDLKGGNIPALLDLEKYQDPNNSRIEPVQADPHGRSYHVGQDPTADPLATAYRSWYVAYNYGDQDKGVRATTLLTATDVTCGVEQVYWSLPDMAVEPVTFRASQNPANFPVVGTELLPLHSRSFYNGQAVYSQFIRDTTNQTHVFNRFPDNQILVRPPQPTITTISENVPTLTDHGTVPIRNSISGVQRVTVTDARRRVCPYVYKSLGIVQPRVLSSRTF
ncbi:III [Tree shrew adenovirus 1]|uniref:Penton protein n=1 Tax=Tree shrew adenovirus serotype 1 TaxID=47680 RepID=A0A2U9AG86_ADET1|nr:III [Tree shrew adenovirus 1]